MAGDRRWNASWAAFVLVPLGVVAAILVFLAVQPPDPGPPTVALDAQSPEPAATSSPTRGDTRMSTAGLAEPASQPAERERPLDALSTSSAVRADQGACPSGDARLEVSDDQGATWRDVTPTVASVLRVSRPGENQVWMVGATGDDCTPGFVITRDAGVSWVGPSATTGAWHLFPDPDATELHAPYRAVESPCGDRRTLEIEPVSFDGASLLCGDGEVLTTTDAGRSWTSDGGTPGAVALGLVAGQPVVAVPSAGDCEGLALGLPGGAVLGCAAGADPRDVALSFADETTGWLLAGDRTFISDDGGLTWKQTSPG